MDRQTLVQHLERLGKNGNEEIIKSLDPRKLQELSFHDRDRDQNFSCNLSSEDYQKFYGNRKFYQTVGKSRDFVIDWISMNAPGEIFLDYACGNGDNAFIAAKAGADLAIGLDLSGISIQNCRRNANLQGICHNTYFYQGDCERTGLPDDCVDVCICSGMLHHLDLSYAFPELRRILKRGGKILAVEALDYNPLIKLYRMMTPDMRTSFEKDHILSYGDIKFAKRYFKVRDIRHWHLTCIAGVYVPGALGFLNGLDDFLLRIPGVKMLSWMITFEMLKE